MSDGTLDYFHQITQIPRPSKHEEKIRDWLISRANKKGFANKVDGAGNLVVYVPATEDKKTSPTVILQAHMDMVCVSSPESDHDFFKDAIQTYEKDGRLCAKNTTLGADNGMAIAMMLAIVDEESHPALELMFTVDEETGLTGALTFEPSLYSGDYLINLDTEDFGEICISSAGGGRIHAKKSYELLENTLPVTLQIQIQGMKGGHSGVDIHRKRGNAIMALAKILDSFPEKIALHSMQGGQADNAIPGTARATISVEDKTSLQTHINNFVEGYKKSHDCPDLSVLMEEKERQADAIQDSKNLLSFLANMKDGVQSMSQYIEGLVQTSINLGVLSLKDGVLTTTHAPRSSVMEELDNLIQSMKQSYEKEGFSVEISANYPGRQQSPEDELVQLTKGAFVESVGLNPEIVAYHAGLECGAIVDRMARPLQAVSFGPTIKNAHSPEECVEIQTIADSYRVLKHILKKF